MAKYLQLPDLPTIVLSDPTETFAAPLMAPCTTMTRGPEALTAADSCGRVLTVVVAPPAPPFVLMALCYEYFDPMALRKLARHFVVRSRCWQHL